MPDERMTMDEAIAYVKKMWPEAPKDWHFHLQMLILDGKVIETDYNALEDRY